MRSGVAFAMLLSGLAWAQTAVNMGQEPHYSLLLQNSLVRVFKLALNANEQAYVIHTHNFLVVALDDCEVVMWREGTSDNQSYPLHQGDVRFFFGGQPIGTRNNRADPCRNVTVEFLDPKVTTYGYQWEYGTWDFGISGISPPVDSHVKFANSLQLGSAVATDVQLLPGDSFSPHPGTAAELLVPVTDVALTRSKKGEIRKSAGEAVWVEAKQKADVVNAGNAPAQLIAVEFPSNKAAK
ncbi:MAG TPA: hypothetical protein VKY85_02710 [Candidatus Angelobacter sp.]|nr:hypothetical protein [Candidatus Angelobacter sp.]